MSNIAYAKLKEGQFGESPVVLVDRTGTSIFDVVGDIVERAARVGSNSLDGRQANDDDQGQHHGVFNRCGAIFALEKTRHFACELFHDFPPKEIDADVYTG